MKIKLISKKKATYQLFQKSEDLEWSVTKKKKKTIFKKTIKIFLIYKKEPVWSY